MHHAPTVADRPRRHSGLWGRGGLPRVPRLETGAVAFPEGGWYSRVMAVSPSNRRRERLWRSPNWIPNRLSAWSGSSLPHCCRSAQVFGRGGRQPGPRLVGLGILVQATPRRLGALLQDAIHLLQHRKRMGCDAATGSRDRFWPSRRDRDCHDPQSGRLLRPSSLWFSCLPWQQTNGLNRQPRHLQREIPLTLAGPG